MHILEEYKTEVTLTHQCLLVSVTQEPQSLESNNAPLPPRTNAPTAVRRAGFLRMLKYHGSQRCVRFFNHWSKDVCIWGRVPSPWGSFPLRLLGVLKSLLITGDDWCKYEERFEFNQQQEISGLLLCWDAIQISEALQTGFFGAAISWNGSSDWLLDADHEPIRNSSEFSSSKLRNASPWLQNCTSAITSFWLFEILCSLPRFALWNLFQLFIHLTARHD